MESFSEFCSHRNRTEWRERVRLARFGYKDTLQVEKTNCKVKDKKWKQMKHNLRTARSITLMSWFRYHSAVCRAVFSESSF